MKIMNTSPISGTQELLPAEQATFDKLKNMIQWVYHEHGFLNVETPMIERCEILLAKAGGDTEKQIYKVIKTAEAAEGADQALRFDHTVPLARYVVEHESALNFPFKAAQTGENFRGERAQKGRFREFYQCDVDVVGRNELPLYYDADVIATLVEVFRRFGLGTPVKVRISNRKILAGVLEGLNLQAKAEEIYGIIDHAEKVPAEKTVAALSEAGLTEDKRDKILRLMQLAGERGEVMRGLGALGIQNEKLAEGMRELEEVVRLLEMDGYATEVMCDMKIVRGLDYYTGTVFELMLPEYREIGSVGGGGRYENLAGYFTEQKFPGVGGSIGLNRLYYILRESGLVNASAERPVDFAVVPITEAELEFAMGVARDLRAEGKSATIVAGDKRLGDKLKYAASVAKNGIVIGEAEAASGEYRVKEFQ